MKKIILQIAKDWDILSGIFKNNRNDFNKIIEELKKNDKYNIIEEFKYRNQAEDDNEVLDFVMDLVDNFNFEEIKDSSGTILELLSKLKIDNLHEELMKNDNNLELLDIILNISYKLNDINKGKLLKFIKKSEDLDFRRVKYMKEKYNIKDELDYYIEELYEIKAEKFYCILLYIIENSEEISKLDYNQKSLFIRVILIVITHLYEIKKNNNEIFKKIYSNSLYMKNNNKYMNISEKYKLDILLSLYMRNIDFILQMVN